LRNSEKENSPTSCSILFGEKYSDIALAVGFGGHGLVFVLGLLAWKPPFILNVSNKVQTISNIADALTLKGHIFKPAIRSQALFQKPVWVWTSNISFVK